MFHWRDLHIGYVNLPHRQDRRDKMEAELKRVGLNAERWEALHTVGEEWNVHPYQKMFARTRGAIGCMISQMSLMKHAYDKGKGCMVLEDDLVIGSDVIKRLDYIETFMNTKEQDADLVFLGGTVHCNKTWWHSAEHEEMLRPYCNCNLERDMERIDDERMVRVYGMFSTHAYFVPFEKIPKILQLLNDVMAESIGIDFSLIIHQPNLKCYAMLPGIIKQYNAVSDIGNGAITYFENFSKLNGSIENSKYWWADTMEEFNPSEFDFAEAKKVNN